jgi:hypothetical protein
MRVPFADEIPPPIAEGKLLLDGLGDRLPVGPISEASMLCPRPRTTCDLDHDGAILGVVAE